MSVFRDVDQFRDSVQDMIDLLRDYRDRAHPALVAAIAEEEQSRGLPKRVDRDAPSLSRPPVDDDDGPCPRSDPIGEQAISTPRELAGLRSALRQSEADFSRSRKALAAALGAISDALEPPKKPEGAWDVDNPMWCENCLTAGVHNPRRPEGGKVCRWCSDFRRQPPNNSTISRWHATHACAQRRQRVRRSSTQD